MPKRMLVHDRRLSGGTPPIAQNAYAVDANVATAHIVDWVGQYARSQGGLDELIVMCHGYAQLSDPTRQMSTAEPVGATGLQLGNPGLIPENVNITNAWRGLIGRIFLYACGTAAGSRDGAPRFDGRRYCGELALWSGATVYAADRLQWYVDRTPSQSLLARIFGSTVQPRIDFGEWEGQVYAFSPDDGRPTPTMLGPQPM